MSEINFGQNSKLVKTLVASAQNERVESDALANANAVVHELVKDFSPHNRYLLAQLVGFTVNDMLKPATDWISRLADVKRIGYGDKPMFKSRLKGVKASIQAKGSTPEVSKVAHGQVSMDTINVSCSPQLNYLDILYNKVQMSDLIVEATVKMQNAILAYVQNTLHTAAATWAAPFYGTGSGVIAATLNPMLTYWQRFGGSVSLLGDIEVINKLAALTGFTASTGTQQYAPSIIEEMNNNGYIGKYRGANVMVMANPYDDDNTTTLIDKSKIYIIPSGADMTQRPLKVCFEGDVQSDEDKNMDDKSYRVRLDQFFGATVLIGTTPCMGAYTDSSL